MTFVTGNCTRGKPCGHYTQLVWANTKYVGCEANFCKNLYDPSRDQATSQGKIPFKFGLRVLDARLGLENAKRASVVTVTFLRHLVYVHFSVTTVVHLTPRPVAASVTLAGLAHNAPNVVDHLVQMAERKILKRADVTVKIHGLVATVQSAIFSVNMAISTHKIVHVTAIRDGWVILAQIIVEILTNYVTMDGILTGAITTTHMYFNTARLCVDYVVSISRSEGVERHQAIISLHGFHFLTPAGFLQVYDMKIHTVLCKSLPGILSS
ncbi:putative GLIPR1-like protein 1 [Apostichopus japonicus]|uniref:Putative GLIPR1-like protein 1 n=1 Tax=Stichopus japonicus TaxID=307972 RepID=A0A2G8LCU0_STIJA|nr:putative GLIPR1-like protein 1 [Apostichopus japonicus]